MTALSFTPVKGGRVRIANTPVRYAQIYLWVGFFIFLLTGRALDLQNPELLVLLVSGGNFALLIGYMLAVKQGVGGLTISDVTTKVANRWVVAGAIYYLSYGLLHFQEYGASGLSDVLLRLLSPGDAYASKFEVYEAQIAEGRVNIGIQLVVLLGALQGALIPLLVVFWGRLGWKVRSFSVLSILVYALFFLFIGTMKGLGDVLIYAAVGLVVRVGRERLLNVSAQRRGSGRRSRWRWLPVGLLGLVFSGYMVSSMQSRLDVLGGGVEEKGVVEDFCYFVGGPSFGEGMAVAISYPVGGYFGLDRNLSQPFEWAYGLGASRALNSYKNQYFGGADYYDLTYPARTEGATGYPALMYWQTIYPWLASDFTFLGSVFFIGIVGAFWARLWLESVFTYRPLSIVLFGQICVFVIYMPANNQIFASRLSFVGLVSLLFFYFADRAFGRKGASNA